MDFEGTLTFFFHGEANYVEGSAAFLMISKRAAILNETIHEQVCTRLLEEQNNSRRRGTMIGHTFGHKCQFLRTYLI